MVRPLFSLLVRVTFGLIMLTLACSTSRQVGSLPSDELFKLGLERYEEKKYLKAIEMFQTVVYNFPGETVVDSAQYYLALSYFGNEDYILAEKEFNRLMLNYPSSPYFVHAQFMRAVCFFEGTPGHYGLDQSDLADAIQNLEDFIIDHPESELLPDAKEYLLQARSRLARKYYSSGVVYVRISKPSAAAAYFQKVIDDFTDTEYAALASFQLAEIEFKATRFDKAREFFNNFLSVFPDHEWAGKASQRSEEAAFKNAEQLLRIGETVAARQSLETFLRDYPESDRTDKVDKYLRQIGETPSDESTIEQARSGTDG